MTGCWCNEIYLSEKESAELRQRYRDCLCRACLKQFVKAQDAPTGPS